MTRTLEALAHLSTAEDFLAFFDIAPDPRVLDRNRVALLRVWASEVAEIDRDPPADQVSRLALYGAALRRAHAAFASGRGHLRLVRPAAPCAGCAVRKGPGTP